MFGSLVTMEMKYQDVGQCGMVTSGHEQLCFAIPVTITQHRVTGVMGWGISEL